MPVVSIARLLGYDDQVATLSAVRQAMEPIGGISAFVKPGQRVLLKVNLVAPARPDAAVTTHPEIVRAVIKLLKEAGAAQIKVGDGPGVGTTEDCMKASGILTVCQEEGAEMAIFRDVHTFERLDNVVGKRLDLTSQLLEADVVITLPKLKTHVQMGYTGALKNQFGLIPGSEKGQYHFKFQNRDRLADLMIDINRVAEVKLAIMDAVVGMEGPGPSGGTPRAIGLVLASPDLSALDAVCCSIIGINPEEYPLLQAAQRVGFGATSLGDIQIAGCDLESVRIADYKLVKTPNNIMKIVPLPAYALRWLRRKMTAAPVIDRNKCIKCLRCRNGCPVKPAAINPLAEKPGQEVKDSCIRCYCCHEFCPVKAIDLRNSWLERIFHIREIGDWASRTLGHIAAWFK